MKNVDGSKQFHLKIRQTLSSETVDTLLQKYIHLSVECCTLTFKCQADNRVIIEESYVRGYNMLN